MSKKNVSKKSSSKAKSTKSKTRGKSTGNGYLFVSDILEELRQIERLKEMGWDSSPAVLGKMIKKEAERKGSARAYHMIGKKSNRPYYDKAIVKKLTTKIIKDQDSKAEDVAVEESPAERLQEDFPVVEKRKSNNKRKKEDSGCLKIDDDAKTGSGIPGVKTNEVAVVARKRRRGDYWKQVVESPLEKNYNDKIDSVVSRWTDNETGGHVSSDEKTKILEKKEEDSKSIVGFLKGVIVVMLVLMVLWFGAHIVISLYKSGVLDAVK